MVVIGLIAESGAGKDACSNYLKEKGFYIGHTGNKLRQLVIEENRTPSDKNCIELQHEMEKKFGALHLPSLIIKDMLNNELSAYNSVRKVADVLALNNAFGRDLIFLLVNASQENRYKRMTGRKEERDKKSFEGFLEDEQLRIERGLSTREVLDKIKELGLNLYTIDNNHSLEEFYAQIDRFIASLL